MVAACSLCVGGHAGLALLGIWIEEHTYSVHTCGRSHAERCLPTPCSPIPIHPSHPSLAIHRTYLYYAVYVVLWSGGGCPHGLGGHTEALWAPYPCYVGTAPWTHTHVAVPCYAVVALLLCPAVPMLSPSLSLPSLPVYLYIQSIHAYAVMLSMGWP